MQRAARSVQRVTWSSLHSGQRAAGSLQQSAHAHARTRSCSEHNLISAGTCSVLLTNYDSDGVAFRNCVSISRSFAGPIKTALDAYANALIQAVDSHGRATHAKQAKAREKVEAECDLEDGHLLVEGFRAAKRAGCCKAVVPAQCVPEDLLAWAKSHGRLVIVTLAKIDPNMPQEVCSSCGKPHDLSDAELPDTGRWPGLKTRTQDRPFFGRYTNTQEEQPAVKLEKPKVKFQSS